jgi:hypothetical protein
LVLLVTMLLFGRGGASGGAWRWALARFASDGEERVVILEREKLRRLLCEGGRFFGMAEGVVGDPVEETVAEGECGGVGPGLRRRSGMESDGLAAIEPP